MPSRDCNCDPWSIGWRGLLVLLTVAMLAFDHGRAVGIRQGQLSMQVTPAGGR